MKTAFRGLLLFLSCWTFAQQGLSPYDYENLVRRIASGDQEAALEAGSSGDVRFVPALRKTIRRFSKQNKAVTESAHLAMAKLGEKQELEVVLCEVHSRNPYIQTRAVVKKLSYIGGWFAISTWAEFLPDTAENHRGTAEGDTTFGSLMYVAITGLRELLPAGPKPQSSDAKFPALQSHEDEAGEWQDWIEKHKDELMRLRPTGSYLAVNCPADAIPSESTKLQGTVSGPLDTPVESADVVIDWDSDRTRAAEFGLQRRELNVTTGMGGKFFVDLFPGPYTVCVRAAGFEHACQKIRIQEGKEATVSFELRKASAKRELMDHK